MNRIVKTAMAAPLAIEQDLITADAHPLAVLLLNPGVRFFRPEDGNGVIGYIVHGRAHVCIGGLIAAVEHKPALLRAWLDWLKQAKGFPVFVHITRQDVDVLHTAGLHINQIGARFTIDLSTYDMQGRAFQQLRNKISKARKAGIRVSEIVTEADYSRLRPRLREIDAVWLKSKAAKVLRHLVTDPDCIQVPSSRRRLFIAEQDQQVLAYVVYTRVEGERPGWFHDLSRKVPDAQNGIMQAINSTALDHFKSACTSEGNGSDHRYLHFGFTPLTEMYDRKHPLADLGSSHFAAIARFLADRGGVVYPARSQRQYKMSWRPQIIEPELIAFPKGKALASLWALLRATDSL